jgi:hypothetical protein
VIEIADSEAGRRRIAPWIRQRPVTALTQLKAHASELNGAMQASGSNRGLAFVRRHPRRST